MRRQERGPLDVAGVKVEHAAELQRAAGARGAHGEDVGDLVGGDEAVHDGGGVGHGQRRVGQAEDAVHGQRLEEAGAGGHALADNGADGLAQNAQAGDAEHVLVQLGGVAGAVAVGDGVGADVACALRAGDAGVAAHGAGCGRGGGGVEVGWGAAGGARR